MPAAIDAFLDSRLGHRPGIVKLIRYSTASVAGLVTSQIVLVGLATGAGMPARGANVIAVMAGAAPNYLINRAWTFGKHGSHSLSREILPYWAMSALGLVMSTFAVGWADQHFDGASWSLSAANIGAFGVLWIAKYVVLDRWLFLPLAEFVEEHDVPFHHHES